VDPNVNLEYALEVAKAIVNDDPDETQVGEDFYAEHMRANELAQYVLALDEWLQKGGFLPDTWSKPAFSNGVTLAQAITLGSKVIANDVMHVSQGGSGLGTDRLLVTYTNDPFVLGIDREGRASS
jgi:hypothetical protein